MINEKLIESVAKAICKSKFGHLRGYEAHRDEWIKASKAAIAEYANQLREAKIQYLEEGWGGLESLSAQSIIC